MIVEAIVEIVMGILQFLVGLLPTWNPVELTDTVAPVLDAMGPVFPLLVWADNYLPVGDFFTIVTMGAGLYGSILTYNFVVWALSKFHIAGGGSQ